MSYFSKINRGLDFIEANLSRDIDLFEVSRAAGMSHWHFQRIFVALTGESLKSYIRSRRLSYSLKSLINSKKRIIEIAIEAGYESQESFSRAFQNKFKMTPGDFRKANNPHLFLDKVKIDSDYMKHISANLSLEPEILALPKRFFVGMRTSFYGIESDKNNMADKLPALWSQFLPRLTEIHHTVAGNGYGLICQGNDESGQLEYFSAVEVSRAEKTLPTEMTAIALEPQSYAKFVHKGPVKNLNHTVNFIYSNWLLNSKYQHTYKPDIEEYGEKYHPTSDESEIYYLVPVAEVEK